MTDIIIKDLNKNFGDKTVIKNLNIIIPKGKITCIMGKSGCGKTTLINIIMGFLSPDGGEITGIPEKISAVFQEDRLSENFTVFSNVKTVTQKNTPKAEIMECLSNLGLEDAAEKPVKELSGGMKRRTAIARSLMSDYELLILDEAFSGLDDRTRISTIKYIKEKTIGKTVISITHNIKEAEIMGNKIINMDGLKYEN